MRNVLLVPIHLDALCLQTDLSVVDAKVDFTRLPYWDGTREINHDIANISEELLARPFEDRGLQLDAGVHLHWALPDALTKGVVEENGTTFPAVPNRWLITRSRKDNTGKERIEKQWIVESDYLSPAGVSRGSGAIAIPFPAENDRPPFRFLGRKVPFSDWKGGAEGQHLAAMGYRLTAIGYQLEGTQGPANRHERGYSEPTFAAFYPNCRSVFGFHDVISPTRLKGVQYDVMGWYSNPKQDCLQTPGVSDAIDAVKERYKKQGRNAVDRDIVKEALGAIYQWDMTEGDATQSGPEDMVCWARLAIATETLPAAARQDKAVTIAVGNTSTEALSAYLAHTLAPQRNVSPSLIEEQLEALHLASRLGNKKLDRGPKFEEARHERGFTAVPGGTLWVVRQATANHPGEAREDAPQETLPDDLAHLLNALNVQQMAYDQAGHELESMQKQLFADWYKYMLCAYPPHDTRDDYPDIDEVRHFIEKNGLLPITRQQKKRSLLRFQCARLHAQLAARVQEYREETKKLYELQPRPAPRYWQPHEPVLLIVDEETAPTTRHGHGGRVHPELLPCQLRSLNELDVRTQPAAVREALGTPPSKAGVAPLHSHDWTKQPWHPFVLEWRVELLPVDEKNNLDGELRQYLPEFITSNYQLEEGAVDLVLKAGKVALEKAAGIYTGSSILTPHAKFQLQRQIKAFLQNSGRPSDDPVVQAFKNVEGLLDSPTFHALAQSLNGLNDALLTQKQTWQMPIADPLGFRDAREFSDAVRDAVGQSTRSAPQPNDDFHPIRTGVLKIHALRLVDTFGRVQNLTLKNEKVMATEVMTTPANPHLVCLPPRLVQPARLSFRWLAADRGQHDTSDEPEMNAHPATTPVCGWLLPNYADNSLMVYDNTGQALGSISAGERTWMPAPGTSHIPNEQWNVHLMTLVNHVLHIDPPGKGAQFLEDFLTGIEVAQERIDPENFAQHEALALLVGRPIAVVRAVLNLEFKGQPAINEDWNVFRTDMARDLERELTRPSEESNDRAERETDAVCGVRIPIRLGDDRQLNDGLVGYWKEQWSLDGKTYTYERDRFYVHACDRAEVQPTDLSTLPLTAGQRKQIADVLGPARTLVKKHDFLAGVADGEALWTLLCERNVLRQLERNPHIHYAADTPDLAQAIADPPQKLTMLVDPRGVVHATCGVLPTKVVAIPADQYAQALRSLAITFLTAPVLTGRGDRVNLPLPAEPGYVWSWIERNDGTWSERSPIGPVTQEAAFQEASVIREGWLKLTQSQERT